MVESIAEPRSRVASIAGLIVALGAPFVLGYVPGYLPGPLTDAEGDIRFIMFEWIVAFTLLAIVIFWERLPLRSIGFRALSLRDGRRVGVIAAIYAALAIIVTLHRGNASLFGLPTPTEIAGVPIVLRAALCLTAGFCEELMFRAYSIERLALFTGNLQVAGIVTTVLFTLAHVQVYGFTVGLVGVLIFSMVAAALYLKTRKFFACAILHAFIDFLGLILRPAIVALTSS
jgi:membrane protease YdiL (CAAX protease family)